MIDDRVTEAYLGQMGDAFAREVQERIHWVCEHCRGEKILDVGCSQGITCLLLGRENKTVLGVDLSKHSIDIATKYLDQEAKSVRTNVQFICADFLSHDFGREKFDTIIIGEVLEHIIQPIDFILKVHDLLTEGGQVIVTVPFGINDFPDHKRTYYLAGPVRLLEEKFEVEYFHIFGKWIGFSAVSRSGNPSGLRMSESPVFKLLDNVEEGFFNIERKIRDDYKAKHKELEQVKHALQACRDTLAQANAKMSILQTEHDKKLLNLEETISRLEISSQKILMAQEQSNKQIIDLQNKISQTETNFPVFRRIIHIFRQYRQHLSDRWAKKKPQKAITGKSKGNIDSFVGITKWKTLPHSFIDIPQNTPAIGKNPLRLNAPSVGRGVAIFVLPLRAQGKLENGQFASLSAELICSGSSNTGSRSLGFRPAKRYRHQLIIPHPNLEKNTDHEVVVALKVPDKVDQLRILIKSLGKHNVGFKKSIGYLTFSHGVSVIIPTYMGADRIADCLESLTHQTLEKCYFEAIVVINGPEGDITAERIAAVSSANPDLQIRTLRSEIVGAAHARNIGIDEARFDHIAFLDDDDLFTENYLEVLLKESNGFTIVVSDICEVEGCVSKNSKISDQITKCSRLKEFNYENVSSVFSMNGCKIVPTFYLHMVRFLENLKSGEDVVFWTELITRFDPPVTIAPLAKHAAYIRKLRPNSVSRQKPNYDFSITQRLCVIRALDNLRALTKGHGHNIIENKIKAQIRFFIIRYINNNRKEYNRIIDELKSKEIPLRVIKFLNEQIARTLVISYCFPPFVDTSGIVVAKRILDMDGPVDVIFNKMEGRRPVDESLIRPFDERIGNLIQLSAPLSFADWKAVACFAEIANDYACKLENTKGGYENLYSRAMWPASHFAAALYKSRNPQVQWTAEFSDPLLKDVTGNDRLSALDMQWLRSKGLLSIMEKQGLKVPEDDRLFMWCELLPAVMADELVFTNANQLQYMLEYQKDSDIRQLMESKARIAPHPTLPDYYYRLSDPDFDIDEENINIAYFGSFYKNRSIEEVLLALKSMTESCRKHIHIYIFTEQKDSILQSELYKDLSDRIKLNSYLGYFDFLALTKKFSYLLINDVSQAGMKINPYLPSKLSDYLGSGVPIWAICDTGSVLSQHPLSGSSLRSRLGDIADVKHALEEMVKRRHSPRNCC